MPRYFVLRGKPSIEAEDIQGYMEIEDWVGIEGFGDWGVGTLAAQRPAGPVELAAVPHDGYSGPPDDFQDFSVPLMSKRMKEALDAASVDNIVFLPVAVRNTETGEGYEYFAFNLVGLGTTDRQRSELTSADGDFVGDTHVHTLALDDEANAGRLMFRLQEKFSVIVVHESVKDAIERHGITTVAFVAPNDFMAL